MANDRPRTILELPDEWPGDEDFDNSGLEQFAETRRSPLPLLLPDAEANNHALDTSSYSHASWP